MASVAEVVRIPVAGMTCDHCVGTVRRALEGVPGVRSAVVDLKEGYAEVALDPAQVDRAKLEAAVTAAGYSVPRRRVGGCSPSDGPARHIESRGRLRRGSPRRTRAAEDEWNLAIGGMHCASCVARVEGALARVPGVSDARVNLATERASVVVDPRRVDVESLAAAVAAAGYTARRAELEPGAGAEALRSERAEHVAYWRNRLVVGVVLTVPLVVLGYGPMLAPSAFGHAAWVGWAMFALATVLQVYLGGPYLRGAWDRLRQGSSNMDTLIALGTSTAYGYSVAQLLVGQAHQAHFFMDAGIILTLITLGKFLEVRSKGAAGAAIERLLDLAPKRALVVRDGREVDVPLAEVGPGRRRAGPAGRDGPGRWRGRGGGVERRRVDADGRVDARSTSGPGDRVTGATLNGDGTLLIEAQRLGRDSALEGIVRMVREAQGSKAGVQRLADTDLVVVRPGRAGHRGGDPARLGPRGGRLGTRRAERGGGADHRLPVRPGPGHADGRGRRHRPRRPRRPARPRGLGLRADGPARDRRPRQDRDRHRGEAERRRGHHRRRLGPRRPAPRRRRGRGRERAPARPRPGPVRRRRLRPPTSAPSAAAGSSATVEGRVGPGRLGAVPGRVGRRSGADRRGRPGGGGASPDGPPRGGRRPGRRRDRPGRRAQAARPRGRRSARPPGGLGVPAHRRQPRDRPRHRRRAGAPRRAGLRGGPARRQGREGGRASRARRPGGDGRRRPERRPRAGRRRRRDRARDRDRPGQGGRRRGDRLGRPPRRPPRPPARPRDALRRSARTCSGPSPTTPSASPWPPSASSAPTAR